MTAHVATSHHSRSRQQPKESGYDSGYGSKNSSTTSLASTVSSIQSTTSQSNIAQAKAAAVEVKRKLDELTSLHQNHEIRFKHLKTEYETNSAKFLKVGNKDDAGKKTKASMTEMWREIDTAETDLRAFESGIKLKSGTELKNVLERRIVEHKAEWERKCHWCKDQCTWWSTKNVDLPKRSMASRLSKRLGSVMNR